MIRSTVIVLFALVSASADEPLEKRCKAVLDEYSRIQRILDAIKDQPSAEKAMKQLEGVKGWPVLKEYKNEKRTEDQKTWFNERYLEDVEYARRNIIATVDRFTDKDERREALIDSTPFGKVLIDLRIEETKRRGRNIRTALMSFYIRSGGDAWPTLKELVEPSDGGRAYLDGGNDAITNSWGQPFQFRIQKNKEDVERPIITTKIPYPKKWTEIEIK